MADSNALGALSDKVREVKRAFYGLQRREQNLIMLMGVVILIAVIYLVAMFPAQNAVAAATKKLEAKQSLLSWMQANEEAAKNAAKSSQGASRGGNKNLLGSVNQAANRYQITLQRSEPEGKDKLRIWLEDTSFNNMVKWLHFLESKRGIAVSSISLDAEKQPGLVSAKIVLKN
ncbi:MAG: type II secretion system protein M [Pseudomonadales bacterium]|nr:type II secretion system protein M [Pseudomonadales bacterium]